jgi:hypothetical protein
VKASSIDNLMLEFIALPLASYIKNEFKEGLLILFILLSNEVETLTLFKLIVVTFRVSIVGLFKVLLLRV